MSRASQCLFLFAAIAAAALGAPRGAAAVTLPSDLWLFPGETFIELIDADLPEGNTTNAAAGWGFPDTSDSSVTVNGNVADSKDHTLGMMDMTISGLTPYQTYGFDAIIFGKRDDPLAYGLSAGFDSVFPPGYDALGDYGRRAVFALGGGALYRIPLGDAVADSNGNAHVYLDTFGSYRAQIDGVVYREPVAPPTPTLIGSVTRGGGAEGNRLPIGPFDGSSGVVPSSDFGLQLGGQAYSDRNTVLDIVDEPLRGAEYVRTFNDDRAAPDVEYSVTFLSRVFAMLTIDDRAVNPQAWVDAIVDAFAAPGTFTDTRLQISAADRSSATSAPHYSSVYGAWLDAGTYVFGGAGREEGEPAEGISNFFQILALADAPLMPAGPGDADNDGNVDGDDAAILAANWLLEIAGGPNVGDFNSDGWVDDLDLAILSANWSPAPAGAAVPEPATWTLLLALAAAGAMLRRRRV
ncbi:MAG: PEP-CTERM sorting domain-containing protein [Pirellulales bacterium]|nr:PEP-CTERM sorting domain-containing protein [Pirellulales bacterium]